MTITVLYSCKECRLVKVGVDVPARVDDQDVVEWMDRTIQLVSNDHRRRSPSCNPKTLSNLMIPMTGRDRIGGPTIQ